MAGAGTTSVDVRAMVMEWQAEVDLVDQAGTGVEEGAPPEPLEASVAELTAAVLRARVRIVARRSSEWEPPEEMIGEPTC